MRRISLAALALIALTCSAPAQIVGGPRPACTAFGTASGTCAQGGVVTGGGPTGGATSVPVITYNAAGQLTAVTTAATGVTTVGTAAVGQIPGTTTNDSANAGNVGQLVSSNIPSGSAVSLTTATVTNITSISLTAGQWTVCASAGEVNGGTTSITVRQGGISATSATMPSDAQGHFLWSEPAIVGTQYTYNIGCISQQLSATTSVFLVGRMDFTISTASMYGNIWAVRTR